MNFVYSKGNSLYFLSPCWWGSLYVFNEQFDGKGKYLSGVQIIPTYVDVMFGFDFNSEYFLQNLVNHASSLEPIAGATIGIHFMIESLTQTIEQNRIFHITGEGKFKFL